MAVNPAYLQAVRAASKQYGVPPELLAGQIQAESGWNPNAKSPAGAVGISQFMPGTAKGYNLDPTDPIASIMAQGKMMGSLLKSYKGDKRLALAAYNAGAGAVAKYHGMPPYKETQNYVDNILNKFQKNYPGLKAGSKLPLPSGATTDNPFGTGPSLVKSPADVSQTPAPGSSQQSGSPGSPVLNLSPQGLLDAAKSHLGTTERDKGTSFIEQTFLQHNNPLGSATDPVTNAPLPSGAFSKVQVHQLKTQPGLDPKLSPSGQGIVAAALKFKGTPYSWGGGGTAGPSLGVGRGANTKGFDCSGLIQYAVFQATGKKIARVASQQLADATPVDIKHAKPGDVIGFGTKSNVHHIGIYIGDGKYIAAPRTGSFVQVSSLAGRNDVVGVGRY